jgi:hypothetical protein
MPKRGMFVLTCDEEMLGILPTKELSATDRRRGPWA